MAPSSSIVEIRKAVLERAFDLLYGPLVLLHEPLGRLAFGPSWAGRRLELMRHLRTGDVVVDVGAGEGTLVRAARGRLVSMVGVDPSAAMRARSASRGAPVLAGSSWDLPFPDASVDVVISTYPGAWIFEEKTLAEFQRVLKPAGRIIVLVGGTVERGRRASFRKALTWLAYGSSRQAPQRQLSASFAGLEGEFVSREDGWGTVYLWVGGARR